MDQEKIFITVYLVCLCSVNEDSANAVWFCSSSFQQQTKVTAEDFNSFGHTESSSSRIVSL